MEHIKEQVANGQQIIEVEHLPYEEYLWTSMPYSGSVWEERYKLFFGLPVELDFVELTYDEMA